MATSTKPKKTKRTTTIEVCERMGDWHHVPSFNSKGEYVKHIESPKYHVQIKENPGCWSAGISPDDAIGNLIRCHPERFGLEINYLGKQAR